VTSAQHASFGRYDEKHDTYDTHEVAELFSGFGCGNAANAKEAAKYIRKFVARKRRALGLKKPAKKAKQLPVVAAVEAVLPSI
jgi:hypothetical protein